MKSRAINFLRTAVDLWSIHVAVIHVVSRISNTKYIYEAKDRLCLNRLHCASFVGQTDDSHARSLPFFLRQWAFKQAYTSQFHEWQVINDVKEICGPTTSSRHFHCYFWWGFIYFLFVFFLTGFWDLNVWLVISRKDIRELSSCHQIKCSVKRFILDNFWGTHGEASFLCW